MQKKESPDESGEFLAPFHLPLNFVSRLIITKAS